MKFNFVLKCLIVVLLFTGCKKYPENKFPILVVPPEYILKDLRGAHLVSYKVNGADSMDVMEKVFPGAKKRIFKYGPNDAPPSSSYYRNYWWKTDSIFDVGGFLYFSQNKKHLSSTEGPFTINNIGRWEVIKLTKKELKVRAQKNNNVYEIYFSK